MKHMMIAACMAMFCAPASAQDADLKKKLDEMTQEFAKLQERVKQLETDAQKTAAENVRLKSDNDKLQRFSMDAAEQLTRLRDALNDLATKAKEVVPSPDSEKTPAPPAGPPLKSKVLVVVPEYGFLIIDKGETDGIKEGSTFNIFRKIVVKGEPDRYESIGQAKFDKYVAATKNHQTKLLVTKGISEHIKYDDLAVLIRPGDVQADDGKGGDLKEQKGQIIGKVKRNDDKGGITIEVGTLQGAKIGMQFDVRRQGRPIGRIVLKEVSRTTSHAEPVGDTRRDEIMEEDFVESVE